MKTTATKAHAAAGGATLGLVVGVLLSEILKAWMPQSTEALLWAVQMLPTAAASWIATYWTPNRQVSW